jgi:perosamine synthetase
MMHGEEEVLAVAEVVRSGKWAGSPLIESTEAQFASAARTDYAVAVGTGLGALRLALRALGIGAGEAVAVPGYSCVALANAVLACGAQPIPVEIDRHSLNMCPNALMEIVREHRPQIRAAIVVHTFGCPANMDQLAEAGVPLIEDCSHAFGRSDFGRRGRVSIMSLYATKLVGAGEGGMVLTSDAGIMARIRSERDYTDQAPSSGRLNDKPSSFTAAIARCQLKKLPEHLARRDHLADRYHSAFAGLAEKGLCRLPVEVTGRVWYRYSVDLPRNIDEVISAMRLRGVATARPVEPWGRPAGDACADAFSRTLSLPMYPALSDDEQDRVIHAFLTSIASL